MKLLTKLTLFITGSKLLIVIFFILLLPSLINKVSFEYTNYSLQRQKKKVLDVIKQNGIDYYLQGDSAYGSYTMLMEEYISLLPGNENPVKDTIETAQRIIEEDTINYRVLTTPLNFEGKNYVLEIGKTTAVINQYNLLLQRFALIVLISLIVLSIVIDLIYTNFLLRPLSKIINSKLVHRKFPFKEKLIPVKTSTTDFKYLDDSLITLMEKIHTAFDKEREFTSNASHELLTPISILQTNLENIMVDESLSDFQQERVSAMMKTLNRLKKIVHSLLYISRIENEQFAKTDIVNVHEVINAIGEELETKLELNQITFINNIQSGLLLKNVNHDLLFQLFYNLISNALRYNKKEGSIKIFNYFDDKLNRKVIAIKDSGIGIKQEDLEYIFNRFRKVKSEKEEGYGLGLSIVKSISDFHKFSLEVTSVFGEGAEFKIIIPEDNN